MAHESIHMATDPFADPIVRSFTERELITESTLAVGKNASLTLGKDAVIVLDHENQEKPKSFCGLTLPMKTQATRSIPYYNILSATLTETEFTFQYAKPVSRSSKSRLSVVTSSYSLSSPHELAEKWTKRLLDRAYGPAQRNKRIKVLINPYGGAGRAAKYYARDVAPIFEAAGCKVDVDTTKYRGHAIELAEQLDITAYDVLACASGDGLPMESFNGLGRKPNAAEALRKIAVVQLPCGTGNAMSWNLNGTDDPSMAALCIVKGVRTPIDLASITQMSSPDKRVLSFLSQSVGIVAESDLGTDNIRWMGDFRFTFGFLVRLLGKTVYPVDIAVKTEIEDKTAIKNHYAQEMIKRAKLDIGSQEILDKDLESATALGLPPLRHGTIADPLPPSESSSGWTPLQSYPNLGNLYSGNMCYMAADAPFFPASLPNDGLLDLVTIDGDISRMKAVGLLLDVGPGILMDRDVVRYRKISCIRVVPRFGWAGAEKLSQESSTTNRKPGICAKVLAKLGAGNSGEKEGCFSVDGEKLPFEPFQVEVHRGLGTVLSKRWGVYEYEKGPPGWKDLVEQLKPNGTGNVKAMQQVKRNIS